MSTFLTKESVYRALRTFAIAFLALFIPGLLGWLNTLTEWANNQGSTPFPDASGLAYLAVSAIVAGVIAVVNLLWNAVEDFTGKGFLRTVPERPHLGDHGSAAVNVLVVTVIVVILLILIT